MRITILKTLITILNLVLISLFAFFSRKLRWNEPLDRSSIIGFGMMAALVAVNTIFVWY